MRHEPEDTSYEHGIGLEKPLRAFDLLAFYRSEIKFESEVVNGRLQALLGSQAFLVIAYATAMTGSSTRLGKEMVLLIPPLLALLGFVLALLARPGIRAAYVAIAKWETKEHLLHQRAAHLIDFTLASSDLDTQDMTRRSLEGALFANRAPLVLMTAWAAFGAIPFWLYFR